MSQMNTESFKKKNVKVGNDQEMAQSERNSLSKTLQVSVQICWKDF